MRSIGSRAWQFYLEKLFYFFFLNLSFSLIREETEIIEGEVVEIQIDRPASGTVG